MLLDSGPFYPRQDPCLKKRKRLFAGGASANKKLFAEGTKANKNLFAGGPLANKTLFAGALSILYSPKWSCTVLFTPLLYCTVLNGL